MQREDFVQGLGLAAVQIRGTVVDAQQRRNVEPIRSKGNSGSGVVADFYWIGPPSGHNPAARYRKLSDQRPRPRICLPLLRLLWDVEQRTLVIGECCRVEDLDAGVVVAGKRRCGTRTACRYGIVRRIEPNPEVINLHRAIGYRTRL